MFAAALNRLDAPHFSQLSEADGDTAAVGEQGTPPQTLNTDLMTIQLTEPCAVNAAEGTTHAGSHAAYMHDQMDELDELLASFNEDPVNHERPHGHSSAATIFGDDAGFYNQQQDHRDVEISSSGLALAHEEEREAHPAPEVLKERLQGFQGQTDPAEMLSGTQTGQ